MTLVSLSNEMRVIKQPKNSDADRRTCIMHVNVLSASKETFEVRIEVKCETRSQRHVQWYGKSWFTEGCMVTILLSDALLDSINTIIWAAKNCDMNCMFRVDSASSCTALTLFCFPFYRKITPHACRAISVVHTMFSCKEFTTVQEQTQKYLRLTAATWPASPWPDHTERASSLITLCIQIWLYKTMGKCMKYIYWEASRELHAVQITYRACFENGSYTVLHQQSQQKIVTHGDGLLIAIKRFISPLTAATWPASPWHC